MLAAVLAHGDTVLENCALEPEIGDLAACLNSMGARIEGAGTKVIRISGVTSLGAGHHQVMADRIEAGTFAVAVAAAGGEVLLKGANGAHIQALTDALQAAGVAVNVETGGVRVQRDASRRLRPVDVQTAPFPGFATDLQAQFMALMTLADGQSVFNETIFENRFMHAPELSRLGAKISIQGSRATVEGVERLIGAPVMATDLRASVSLVIAGLSAQGETVVNRVYHLDRGFERLEQKLAACGAVIERKR